MASPVPERLGVRARRILAAPQFTFTIRVVVTLVGAAGAALFWAGAAGAGLPPAARASLGVASLGGGLWASELLPLPATALLVTVLLYLSGAVSQPEQALEGFASPVVFFLLASASIGVAAQVTGLMDRLARWLVAHSRGSSRRLVLDLLLSLPFQALLVPSATSRNTVLVPMYEQVLEQLDRPKRLGATIMLILAVLGPFASSALLSGGVSPVAAAAAIGGFNWISWFLALALPYYLLIAVCGAALWLFARPEAIDLVRTTTDNEPRLRFSAAEWRVVAITVATSVLWILDQFTHWSPAIPAIIALFLFITPHLGVMSWQDFTARAPWSPVFVLAGATSLAEALARTGADAWLARRLFGLFPVPHTSVATALTIFVVAALISLLIPGRAAVITLVVPLAIAFAASSPLAAPAAGLAVLLAVDAQTLYPAQTTTGLLAYESGYFRSGQLFRYNLVTLAATALLLVFVAMPWWSFVSLPLLGH